MILRPSLLLSNNFRFIYFWAQWRNFTGAAALLAKPLPPRIVIKDEDIEENYLKGSGPGGQKIVRHELISTVYTLY